MAMRITIIRMRSKKRILLPGWKESCSVKILRKAIIESPMEPDRKKTLPNRTRKKVIKILRIVVKRFLGRWNRDFLCQAAWAA